MELKVGMTKEIETVVTKELTACVAKSGELPVYATPFMIALMEEASAGLLESFFESSITSVGTAISIEHFAATAVGAKVKAIAKLVAVEGRKYSFEVEAYDNAGLIGKGTHERFSVKADKFMKKAEERKAIINE